MVVFIRLPERQYSRRVIGELCSVSTTLDATGMYKGNCRMQIIQDIFTERREGSEASIQQALGSVEGPEPRSALWSQHYHSQKPSLELLFFSAPQNTLCLITLSDRHLLRSIA